MTRQLLKEAQRSIGREHKRSADGRLRIGLFAFGGHGDFMRLMTFAAAVRKQFPKKLAHLTVITKYVQPTYDDPQQPGLGKPGWDVNEELLHMIGCQPHMLIDYCLLLIQVHWAHAVKMLRRRFDHFWEVQYTARLSVHPRLGGRWNGFLGSCERACAPWREVFDGFPESNPRLSGLGQSQFETLAASSGLAVTEDDLRLDVQSKGRAVLLGGRSWEPVVEAPTEPYITWHNGAGGRATVKCLPEGLVAESVAAARVKGLHVVQVGRRDKETLVDGCIDMLGTSILDTAVLLNGAVCHFDVEGGIRYLSHALGVPSVTFFGPTPPSLFGFRDGGINYTREECEPCWWSKRHWDRRCMRGHPHCKNMPQDAKEIRRLTATAIDYARTWRALGVPPVMSGKPSQSSAQGTPLQPEEQ